LLFFSNSEGFDFNPIPVDLRGLEDLKGRPTFAVFFQTAKVLQFHFTHLNFRGLKDLKGLD
jgi:hypothetical protein